MTRDQFATCPTCGTGLDPNPDGRRRTCGTCHGVLVEETGLLDAITAVIPADVGAPTTLAFEPPSRPEPVVTCPRCTATMTKHSLYGIQVDRCEIHGVWFDNGELQGVLAKMPQNPELTLGDKIQLGIGGVGVAGVIAVYILRYVFGM